MNVVVALRDLFSQYPGAIKSGSETLGKLLYVLRFLPYRPDAYEVEEALEALQIEGELAA